jgi:hypothetical protein
MQMYGRGATNKTVSDCGAFNAEKNEGFVMKKSHSMNTRR